MSWPINKGRPVSYAEPLTALSQQTVRDILDYAEKPSPTTVGPGTSVVAAAVFIAVSDLDYVVVAADEKPYGLITGYNILKVFVEEPAKAWTKLYQTKAQDLTHHAVKTTLSSSLEQVLESWRLDRWGYSLVMSERRLVNVLSSLDVLNFLLSEKLRTTLSRLTVTDVMEDTGLDCRVKLDVPIQRAMEKMLGDGVRKLIAGNRILADKDFLTYLFTQPVLDVLRDSPAKALNAPVSAMENFLKKPATVASDEDMYSVALKIMKSEAKAAVYRELGKILTPYDVAMSVLVR
ncbi:MAG: hypothetical protein QXR26_04035 [Candidatus Caldarchaeum sp.]